MPHDRRLGLFVVLLWILIAPPAPAQQPVDRDSQPAGNSATKFLRVLRDDNDQPTALQTAIVRYVPADGEHRGLVIDLIGAIHVGDKSYFEALNGEFQAYDALLYELVAAEGAAVPNNGANNGERRGAPNAVSALQMGLKSLLELEFQLEHIDYSKDNFVHADMSPDEFAQSMQQRGESFLQIFFRMLANAPPAAADGRAQPTDADVLAALFAKDRAMRLKRIFAQQFEDLDVLVAVFEGPGGSTLVTERNKKALQVLQREVDAGKKNIAIFYGAAHLADMETRLLADFGLKRDTQRWLTAWSLTTESQPAAEPATPAQDR